MRRTTTRPVDLAAVAALATAALAAVALELPGLQLGLGLLLVLVLPGYALAAAAFPARPREVPAGDGTLARRGPDALERAALALGLSVAASALLAIALNTAGVGIRPLTVAGALWATTTAASAVGARRRARLPEDERLLLTLDLAPPRLAEYAPTERAVLAALLVAVLVGGGALAWAAMSPEAARPFTELYVLDADGRAAQYPTNVTANSTHALVVGLANHEDRTIRYRLDTVLSRSESVSNFTTLVSNTTLATRTMNVGDEETWRDNETFRAPSEPGMYRLAWNLHRFDDPEPHRSVHLWILVRPAE